METVFYLDEGLDDSHGTDSNDNSMSRNSDLDLSEVEFRNSIHVTSSVNGVESLAMIRSTS